MQHTDAAECTMCVTISASCVISLLSKNVRSSRLPSSAKMRLFIASACPEKKRLG
jgi:hypothetical protein